MMKLGLNRTLGNWKSSMILCVGGLLCGAGIADCIYALNQLDLNQIARGITIFSAGLTILVIMDNSKTNKVTLQIQKETLLRLQAIEDTLQVLQQSKQMQETELHEIKQRLSKSISE